MSEEKKEKWTKKNEFGDTVLNWKRIWPTAVGGVVLLFVLIFGWPISCVSQTDRGIRYTFGAGQVDSSDDILAPGIQYHAPFVGSVKTWSIKPRTYDVIIDINSRGAISSDNQIIGMEGKVVWSFDPNKVHEIARRYPSTEDLENIIKNTCYNAAKEVIGQYTIFDLAKSQDDIRNKIDLNLKRMLTSYPIVVEQFNLTNFDWNSEFDAQINATMELAQQVKQAEQAALKSEQEQRRRTIEAQAQAAASVATAQGELDSAKIRAEAKLVEARAEMEANQLRNDPSSIAFLQLSWAHEERMEQWKRWNGVNTSTYLPLSPNGGVVTLPATSQK